MKHPTIVLALTDNYLDKSEVISLLKSLIEQAPLSRKCLFIINKNNSNHWHKWSSDIINQFEWHCIDLNELTSYRSGWPTNRPFFACAEGGEWLSHFSFSDDEIILHIDADFLMQRPFSANELAVFNELQQNQVLGNYHTYPSTSLREEFWRLLPNVSYNYAKKVFPGTWTEMGMFCTGFVCCRASTYSRLSVQYLSQIDQMISVFDHHAAGQWLMNWIVANQFQFVEAPISLHNGSWYLDSPTADSYNALGKAELIYIDELVCLNHTKFLHQYY